MRHGMQRRDADAAGHQQGAAASGMQREAVERTFDFQGLTHGQLLVYVA